MKNLRILIAISLMGVGAVAQISYAEQGKPDRAPIVKRNQNLTPQQIIERRLSSMAQRLGLTIDQQAAVKPILEAEKTALIEIAKNKEMTREQKSAKVLEIRNAASDKIRSVLTPDQQQLHDKFQKQASERRTAKGRRQP